MKLHFSMCMQCGSMPRYQGIVQWFKRKGIEAEFSNEPGADGSFEVYKDGELIYSKTQTGKYPTPPEIQALVEGK